MTPSRPRALIFDWDNTLVDTWTVIHHALTKTFNAMGEEPWTLEETRQRVRRSAREAFPEIFGARAPEASRVFYETYEADHLALLRPLEGAEELLLGLSQCNDLYRAVLSNKAGHLLRREVMHLGWAPHFDQVVGANDARRDKPARDALDLALEQSTLKAGPDVWVIGDTDIDMACAVDHGCLGLLVRPEPPGKGEFSGSEPHGHVRDCRELMAHLGRSGLAL